MEASQISIADFADYRDFVAAKVKELKQRSSKFSFQYLAQRTGLSKSAIRFIVTKERHIVLDRVPDLARAFALSESETSFFYFLVCRNTSQRPDVQQHFDGLLDRLRAERCLTLSVDQKGK